MNISKISTPVLANNNSTYVNLANKRPSSSTQTSKTNKQNQIPKANIIVVAMALSVIAVFFFFLIKALRGAKRAKKIIEDTVVHNKPNNAETVVNMEKQNPVEKVAEIKREKVSNDIKKDDELLKMSNKDVENRKKAELEKEKKKKEKLDGILDDIEDGTILIHEENILKKKNIQIEDDCDPYSSLSGMFKKDNNFNIHHSSDDIADDIADNIDTDIDVDVDDFDFF